MSRLSPDGTSLMVFGRSFRWVLGPDGSGRRTLPVEEGITTTSVDWFPDSRHVAVVEEIVRPVGFRIVILDTKGTARRLVLHTVDWLEDVSVSPDGARLVYASGPSERDIAEYSIAGSLLRPVAATANLEGLPAAWMPDGLTLISTDGSHQRLIAKFGEFAGLNEAQHLFGKGGAVLYLLKADRRSIDVIEVESGRTVQTMRFDLPPEDTITGFAVHPSGTRVLLTTGGSRGDVWVVEGFARPAAPWRRWLGHWQLPG